MQIRVVPEQMRAIASRQRAIMNDMAEIVHMMDELRKQLADAWEGVASKEAQNAFEKVRDDFKLTVVNAEECSEKILAVADAFEDVDGGNRFKFVPFKAGAVAVPLIHDFILSLPGPIRIDPDRVRDIANQCGTVNNRIDDNVNNFYQSVNELQECWEGRSYQRYEEETKELIVAFKKSQESMDSFTAKIIRAANRYEEIDNSL